MENVKQRDRAARSIEALRARLVGEVVAPGDPEWDEARRAWNLAVDQQPALVAMVESPADVAEVLSYARSRGLRVAPQGTGHAAEPLGPLVDTILLKTSRMRTVEIDPEARIARVEAGVVWIEVVEAAAVHGLATLAGSSPDVGVVGYTLGGGLSWLGRKHGLAANAVTAVELVTADGRLVRADADHEPDLFWAVRGGGGSFGVVTALEFRLLPIADVYAGVLFYPVERASEVLHAWREWVADVPDELTSVGRIMQFPPLPEVPEPLRGHAFALVEAIHLGSEEEGPELLRPLRELGPVLDTVATIPVQGLSELHMDPPHPVPATGDGMLLSDLPPEAVDAVVAITPGSPLLSVEVRHLGGALVEPKPEHGALASLDAGFAVFGVGMAVSPEMEEAVRASLARLVEALAPWDSGSSYLNFDEHRRGVPHHRPEAARRLAEVKARYDASNVIRANHAVEPARAHRIGRTRRVTPPKR